MATKRTKSTLPGKAFTVTGHDLHLLHTPEDRLQAVLALIGSAQTSVRMFFYMFGDDATGCEVRDALVGAAARGVDVHLIIDSFGSGDTAHEFFDPLVKAGGHYHCFGSRWGFGYFIRNHQKILICDYAHALVGGCIACWRELDQDGPPGGEGTELGLLTPGRRTGMGALHGLLGQARVVGRRVNA